MKGKVKKIKRTNKPLAILMNNPNVINTIRKIRKFDPLTSGIMNIRIQNTFSQPRDTTRQSQRKKTPKFVIEISSESDDEESFQPPRVVEEDFDFDEPQIFTPTTTKPIIQRETIEINELQSFIIFENRIILEEKKVNETDGSLDAKTSLEISLPCFSSQSYFALCHYLMEKMEDLESIDLFSSPNENGIKVVKKLNPCRCVIFNKRSEIPQFIEKLNTLFGESKRNNDRTRNFFNFEEYTVQATKTAENNCITNAIKNLKKKYLQYKCPTKMLEISQNGIYFGETQKISKATPEGIGKFWWTNSSKNQFIYYSGNWKNGMWHGHGFLSTDSFSYQGEFHGGYYHTNHQFAVFKILSLNGIDTFSKYEGEFTKGNYNGVGQLIQYKTGECEEDDGNESFPYWDEELGLTQIMYYHRGYFNKYGSDGEGEFRDAYSWKMGVFESPSKLIKGFAQLKSDFGRISNFNIQIRRGNIHKIKASLKNEVEYVNRKHKIQRSLQSKKLLLNGNYFHSKLELRWYLFFQQLNLDVLYEPMSFRFKLSHYKKKPKEKIGKSYTPDFYLPGKKFFIEIKGETRPTALEMEKMKFFRKEVSRKFGEDFRVFLVAGTCSDGIQKYRGGYNVTEYLDDEKEVTGTNIQFFECSKGLPNDIYKLGKICNCCQHQHPSFGIKNAFRVAQDNTKISELVEKEKKRFKDEIEHEYIHDVKKVSFEDSL